MTLEKYRAMQRYDDARTRVGRIYGFILIARANAISWSSTVNITVRALSTLRSKREQPAGRLQKGRIK